MSRASPSYHQRMDLVNAGKEPWEWQDDIELRSDSPLDISHCLWEEVNQSGKDSWCVFDETTPVKDYAGFDCPVSSVPDEVVSEKGMEERRTSSSQLKRRRMLQFTSSETTTCISNKNISSAFVKSKIREDSLIEESGDLYFSNAVPEDQLWVSSISEEHRSPGSECMDQSPEAWMMECFNEQEMQMSSDDINLSGVSEEQLNASDFCNMLPEVEMDARQEFSPQGPHTRLTGSPLAKTTTKATTPVAYPFTLVKPCGVEGGVTLNDINQRILTPLASKSKHKKNRDAAPSYPTSAFSGKPVVALTKIHTEGGKGSITIMRTKG